MLIKKARDIKSSEITDKETYLNRRQFMAASAAAAGALALPGFLSSPAPATPAKNSPACKKVRYAPPTR